MLLQTRVSQITKTIYSLYWIRSFIQSHLVDAAELIFPLYEKKKEERKESACFNFHEGERYIYFRVIFPLLCEVSLGTVRRASLIIEK